MDLPVTVVMLLERTMEEFHLFWEAFLVADGSSSVYQGGEHRMLIDWVVVVELSIHIQVGVGWLPVHTVPQGAIWSSVRVNVQEGKMAAR
jgi:hypothetical protein